MAVKSPFLILCLAVVVPLVVLTAVTYIYLILWAIHEGPTDDSGYVVMQDALVIVIYLIRRIYYSINIILNPIP